jgi:hypothetical protein
MLGGSIFNEGRFRRCLEGYTADIFALKLAETGLDHRRAVLAKFIQQQCRQKKFVAVAVLFFAERLEIVFQAERVAAVVHADEQCSAVGVGVNRSHGHSQAASVNCSHSLAHMSPPRYHSGVTDRESNFDGISVTFHSVGDSDWMDDVAIPLSRGIEKVVPRHIGKIPPPLRQRMNRSGAAANGLFGIVVVGVVIFVAQKIGGKGLEDFYDVVLKPRFRKHFKKLDARLSGGNRKAQKEFTINIWYQQHDVVVSVSIVGEDMAAIESQLDLMEQIHLNALTWVETRGVSAPVHQYRIENGKVNAKPMLLERLELV